MCECTCWGRFRACLALRLSPRLRKPPKDTSRSFAGYVKRLPGAERRVLRFDCRLDPYRPICLTSCLDWFLSGITGTLPARETVDLGGHDEVALGEAIYFVGPQSDFGFAPGEKDVGMVSLLFGERTDMVDQGEGLLEVGELELAMKVMLVGDLPLRDALVQPFNLFDVEGGNASTAGDTLLVRELFGRLVRHGRVPWVAGSRPGSHFFYALRLKSLVCLS